MGLLFNGRTFAGLLFDMDGTLLNSTVVVERVWAAWAATHGLDTIAVLEKVHGVRAIEIIQHFDLPGIDAQLEASKIAEAEISDIDGIMPISGAANFLASLPSERWAIVTSAPRELAEKRITAAGLLMPKVLVAADDVLHGKPNPECFLLAARRLGVEARDCLVFEDAAVGILAAKAAGAAVMVVSATRLF